MDLVCLIDQLRAVPVCSSELLFEFVLGGDPDRLARVTGKLESQPGLEVQLALRAVSPFLLCWAADFLQTLFNQRLRLVSCDSTCWEEGLPVLCSLQTIGV